MFSGCKRIKEVTLKDIETELIFETTSMFESCTSLKGVKFENTNVYNIVSTAKMFQKCSSLNIIEIEDFSTNKTKDMSKMFDGCTSLDNSTFIEGLSTKSAESMDEMFSGCSNITSLNLSGYDTSNVKNMSGMFKGMTSLEELEISSFHTENVEYMSEMFESCTSIISLDLSNFNTEMVINMDRMFSSCLKLETVDLTSFNLRNCNSTVSMFSNTTRELLLSIEKNDEIMTKAGFTWEGTTPDRNDTCVPLYLLFLVDATGSMMGAIEKVKDEVIYISVNLMKKKGMENFDLSLGAIFYRDPEDSYYDIHEIFDFDKNPLNFKNFVKNISADGGGDGPEDWAGAFELSRNLSWKNDSFRFIIHIADAPGHGDDWIGGNDYYYKSEGNRTDEIITYFAKNDYNIAGFIIEGYSYALPSFKRAQSLFRKNGNFHYFINYFSTYEIYQDYFLDLVYESFQNILNTEILYGFDLSEEQGDIDWKKVKGNNNIDFVIIRAGIGNETDTKFEKNYIGAKNNNIPIGLYWTSKAKDEFEASNEAEILKKSLEGKKFEFPIYYVIEDEDLSYYSYSHNTILDSFCDNLNSLNTTKYSCGLRTTKFKIENNFDGERLEDYKIWINENSEDYPDTKVDWTLWRYNSSGKINGIDGEVSLDKSFINYTKIIMENNLNGY